MCFMTLEKIQAEAMINTSAAELFISSVDITHSVQSQMMALDHSTIAYFGLPSVIVAFRGPDGW